MTQDQFASYVGNAERADQFYPFLVKYFPQFEINTLDRVKYFLAQAAEESINFSSLTESTNYRKPETLIKIFPRHFVDLNEAARYAGKPEAIANRVYANRLGNGSEASGEGSKYRGRGIFQITGKDSYREYGLDTLHMPEKFVDNPELLATPEYAVHSALWFWKSRGLSRFADAQDFKELTRRINGGYNGLEDRLACLAKADKIFL